jgi:hypothetical protein
VTPLTSWHNDIGAQHCGPDFRSAQVEPYFLDQRDVCRAGDSQLLEVPVTILRTHPLSGVTTWCNLDDRRYARAIARRLRLWRGAEWFRPRPQGTGDELIRVYECAKRTGLSLVEMMFHSSELMPGGSPFWPDATGVEHLYAILERAFAHALNDDAEGVTLETFCDSTAILPAKPRVRVRSAA